MRQQNTMLKEMVTNFSTKVERIKEEVTALQVQVKEEERKNKERKKDFFDQFEEDEHRIDILGRKLFPEFYQKFETFIMVQETKRADIEELKKGYAKYLEVLKRDGQVRLEYKDKNPLWAAVSKTKRYPVYIFRTKFEGTEIEFRFKQKDAKELTVAEFKQKIKTNLFLAIRSKTTYRKTAEIIFNSLID